VDKKHSNTSVINLKDQDQKANKSPHVPKSVHVAIMPGTKVGEERPIPTLPEVEAFFHQQNYPLPEAQKFFYYNQGKAWMISESLHVTDWKSFAHKWMLNTKTQKQNNDRTQYLHTRRGKNYSEPL
jgi:hypothetical protein